MAKIKKHDFVEIEYTGKVKDGDSVFDTTDEAVAKEHGIFDKDVTYGPIIVCVGEGQVIRGMDDYLGNADAPSECTLEIKPEQGFGRKDSKLVRMIPTNKFTEQNIAPMPGLQVNIDGLIGIVKTVGGGRTLVDFNHPLASKELTYSLRIKSIISDDLRKVESFMKIHFGPGIKVESNEGSVKVSLKQEIPKEMSLALLEKVKEVIPTIKDITFVKENK